MSFTSTVSMSDNKVARTSSLLLSPSKRRKVSEIENISTSTSGPSAVASTRASRLTDQDKRETSAKSSTGPSTTDIWKWTLRKDAIASCFVKDVLEMRDNGVKDAEFYWLGRIPCRSVRLVGLIVGVQVYEQRSVYTLDDGTSVIDCIQRHSPQVRTHPSPPKFKSRYQTPSTSKSVKGPDSTRRELLSAGLTSLQSSPPKPAAEVGVAVRIVGRVVNRGERRILLIDNIDPCSSPNEEPEHWLSVLDLHRTSYSAQDLGPFVPPPPTAPPVAMTRAYNHSSPSKVMGKDKIANDIVDEEASRAESSAPTANGWEPQTPSSGVGSTEGSPSSVSSGSSRGRQSPLRLRHPSRLHTRDLTANTFRIYVKHYMDNAPRYDPLSQSTSTSRSVSPSPFPRHNQPLRTLEPSSRVVRDDGLLTPKKLSSVETGDQTPRPSQLRARLGKLQNEADRTPRALKPSSYPRNYITSDTDNDETESSGIYGFTLSYLRHVPELAILARRVVDAEARRRAREERNDARTVTTHGKRPAGQRPQSAVKEPKKAKIKRLFRFAIRQLFEEGSIVLWDGPARALPSPALTHGFDALWKMNTSSNTTVSTVSSISHLEDDEGELSDPPPAEEAYVPLAPPYFATIVEHAIKDIMVQAKASQTSKRQSRVRNVWDLDSLSAPPPGPTAAEILAWLHRDSRWERVGEWAVKETLEWAKKEGKVWCVGNGKWEVCQ